MKKLLVDIWNCLFDCYLTVRNSLYLFMDIPYRKVVIAPHVVSIEETIRYIIQSHCSVSRLGDGEIKIANGKALAFQTQQPLLQQKMQEVLSVPISNHIVCLPDIFTDLSLYNIEATTGNFIWHFTGNRGTSISIVKEYFIMLSSAVVT